MADQTAGTYSYIPSLGLFGWQRTVPASTIPTDDLTLDDDHDGLSNWIEIHGVTAGNKRGPLGLGVPDVFYSDPENADSDGDGMLDGEELGKPYTAAELGGWTSDDPITVFNVVSDPSSTDGDRDGVDDVEEVDSNLNALDADEDSDGLNDSEEREWGTFPMLADTDSDNYQDGFEAHFVDSGFDPVNRNEMLPQQEWLADFALGAFCGDNDVCRRDTIPWLVGNVLSSIAIYGDVRDFVAGLLQGNWLNAGVIAIGFIPYFGDTAEAAAKIVRALSHLKGEAAKAAVKMLRAALGESDTAFIGVMRTLDGGLIDKLAAYGMSDASMARVIINNDTALLKKIFESPRLLSKPPYPHGAPSFLATGEAGETFLKKFLGVEEYKHTRLPPPDPIPGSLAGGRWPDAIVGTGTSQELHESKVGFVRGIFAGTQVRKDAALVAAAKAKSATWHFFASDRTGKIGPSAELLRQLEEAGIDFYIHFP